MFGAEEAQECCSEIRHVAPHRRDRFSSNSELCDVGPGFVRTCESVSPEIKDFRGPRVLSRSRLAPPRRRERFKSEPFEVPALSRHVCKSRNQALSGAQEARECCSEIRLVAPRRRDGISSKSEPCYVGPGLIRTCESVSPGVKDVGGRGGLRVL